MTQLFEVRHILLILSI